MRFSSSKSNSARDEMATTSLPWTEYGMGRLSAFFWRHVDCKKLPAMKTFALFVLAAGFAGSLALGGCDQPVAERQPAANAAPWEAGSAGAGATRPPAAAPATLAGSLPDFTPLMKTSGPAVVNIITTNKATAPRRGQDGAEDPMLEFFRRFLPDMPPGGPGGPGGQPRGGMGSGFIVS